MRKCSFLTMDSLEEFVCYDHLLVEPLAERGWSVEEVSWRDPDPRWDRFEAVVIRSPWDYQDDPDRFLEVLEEIDRSRALLLNPLALVRWNLDKRYLLDLERNGVPIVPTLWREGLDRQTLGDAFAALRAEEIVVKPVVGANADDTFRLSRPEAERLAPRLEALFRSRSFMVQPFLAAVVEEGEYSLFFFGGKYSHAILKTPKTGDFRVQEEHGGTPRLVEVAPGLLARAEAALAAVRPRPLYARADFVRRDGDFALMELELIEPSLYFNLDSRAAGRFAEAFVRRMSG